MRILMLAWVWLLATTGVDVETRSKDIADRLAHGDFAGATASFDDTMRAALPADKLEQVWKQVQSQAGPLQAVEGTRREPKGAFTLVFVGLRFQAARLDLKLAWKGDRVAGFFIVPPAPPPAAAPSDVTESEVKVGPLALPGTLTLPRGTGPFPALVLVHGSGPHDRDESIGPNKPFLDLAWGLARQGVAVLRYEKRTAVHPESFDAKKGFTVREETVDDAVAAADLLRHRPEIDPKRVFVLGHSLGGTLAPRIGAADPQIAGLVILAGATRSIPDLVVEQMTYIAGLDGKVTPEEQAGIDKIGKEVERLRSGKLAPGDVVLGAPASYWQDLAGYDPAAAAAAYERPMLILQGGRDYQVTAADLAGWEKALKGRADVTIRPLPDLNHLFITGTGKSRPEEYQQPGHVAPEAIDAIAAWIKSGASAAGGSDKAAR